MSRLKELRERQHIDQRTLAEMAGIDQAQISRWEAGKAVPRLDTALAVARVLGVSVEALGLGEAVA